MRPPTVGGDVPRRPPGRNEEEKEGGWLVVLPRAFMSCRTRAAMNAAVAADLGDSSGYLMSPSAAAVLELLKVAAERSLRDGGDR